MILSYMPELLQSNYPHRFDSKKKGLLQILSVRWACVDRTKTVDLGIKTKPLPLPQFNPEFDMSFEDVCDKRALDLILTGKSIAFFWSGGIDSTCALAALLRNNIALDQITVYLNQRSIREALGFFKSQIENSIYHVRSLDIRGKVTEAVEKNMLVVTGEMGDQILGTGRVRILGSNISLPWETAVSLLAQKLSIEVIDWESLKCLVDKAPFKIKIAFDAFWWFNFVTEWNAMYYRMYTRLNQFPFYNPPSHFFDCPEFQQWSMTERNRVFKMDRFDDLKRWKWVAKRYIFSLDKNKEYYQNKGKAWLGSPFTREDFLAVFHDGNIIRHRLEESLLFKERSPCV
jgi:hypothetical protein